MGQPNLKRTAFKACEPITSALSDDRQELAFTGYYELGDTVDILELDPSGNILSTLASNIIINVIEGDTALTFDTTIDTSAPPNSGIYHACVDNIDDGQEAIDRLYRRKNKLDCPQELPIVAQTLNSPVGGQTTYEVDSIEELIAGDIVKILDIGGGGGEIGTATVISVAPNADNTNNKSEVVIDSVIDTSAATTPIIQSQNVSVNDCIDRLGDRIDQIDLPVENEESSILNGQPDGEHAAFELDKLFLPNSSKVFLDGNRKKKGVCGTRAFLEQGTFPGLDDSLRFDSMLLGLLGNEIRVEVVSAGGLGITITKDFASTPSGINTAQTDYLIQINNNSDAATAEELADALNADADAKRLIQVRFGGDGSGTVSAFGPTALTGGLDDGTGDYCEIEQVFENKIVDTGFKFISFHIRPDEPNRMNVPPCESEELCFDYRRALVNA